MVEISFFFWSFVFLFAVIGAMRGWAQELLVTFSVFLSLFIINVLRFVPFVNELVVSGYFNDQGAIIPIDETTFWVRVVLLAVFTFFGYQTPRISTIKKAAAPKERVQDTLMGLLVGAINGYLVIGTLWFFLEQNGYQVWESITPPATETALRLVEALPPTWLSGTTIYFAIALAFAFVVVVFI